MCVYTHVYVIIFIMCSSILNCISTTAGAPIYEKKMQIYISNKNTEFLPYMINLLKSVNNVFIIILLLHYDQRKFAAYHIFHKFEMKNLLEI